MRAKGKSGEEPAKVCIQSVRQVIVQALARPYLLAALTLYWLWVNVTVQSPLFFPEVVIFGKTIFPSWFGPVIVGGISYFAIGVKFREASSLARQSKYGIVVSLLMTGGAVLCLVWIYIFDASVFSFNAFAAYFFGSVGIGVGTACLLVEWGRVFGLLGPREVIYQGIVAMLLSAVALAVLAVVPDSAGRIVLASIPVPLMCCFARATKHLPKQAMYEQGLEVEVRIPWKFLITAFLHGLALGVLLGSFTSIEGYNGTLVSALSFIVAALLLLLTSVFAKMDFNHLIYQVGFPIMASGAVAIACMRSFSLVGESIQLVGFCYVHLIMWGLCSYLTKRFSLSAAWVVAWPTCCLMLGQFIGGAAGGFIVQHDSSGYQVTIAATLVSFILLFAALCMMSNRNLTTGWGIAVPANAIENSSPVDLLDQTIRAIAVETGLTPRETDTLLFFARGYNRRSISEELTVSKETVKSHINGIYRKMNIHSQQELIVVVKEREESLKLSLSGSGLE